MIAQGIQGGSDTDDTSAGEEAGGRERRDSSGGC